MFNKLLCLIKGHKYKDDVLVTKWYFPYQESYRHIKRCERCGEIIYKNTSKGTLQETPKKDRAEEI